MLFQLHESANETARHKLTRMCANPVSKPGLHSEDEQKIHVYIVCMRTARTPVKKSPMQLRSYASKNLDDHHSEATLPTLLRAVRGVLPAVRGDIEETPMRGLPLEEYLGGRSGPSCQLAWSP